MNSGTRWTVLCRGLICVPWRTTLPEARQWPPSGWTRAYAAHPLCPALLYLADFAYEEARYDINSLRHFAKLTWNAKPYRIQRRGSDFVACWKITTSMSNASPKSDACSKAAHMTLNTGTIVDAALLDPPVQPRTSRRNVITKCTRLSKGNRGVLVWSYTLAWTWTVNAAWRTACVVSPTNVHDDIPSLICCVVMSGAFMVIAPMPVKRIWSTDKRSRPATLPTIVPVRLVARSIRSSAARTAKNQR